MTTEQLLEMKEKLEESFENLIGTFEPDGDNAICVSFIEEAAADMNSTMCEFDHLLQDNWRLLLTT